MAHDLATVWAAWIDLLETNGFVVRALLQPPATDADLAALEAATGLHLPSEIAAFYRLNNGQRPRPILSAVRDGTAEPWPPGGVALFGFYEFLSTEGAATCWQGWKDVADGLGADEMASMAEFVTTPEPDKVKQEYWLPGWLPFGLDGGGNSVAFDLDPQAGGTVDQVIIIGADEDDRHVFAPSISDLLARMIAAWQAGRVTFEAGDDGTRYYDLPLLRGEAD